MNNKYDVIIIGGGAAGMMAAISTKRHHPDKSVLIIDRTFELGRKILICGAGRCNITNLNLSTKIEDSYHGANDDFVKSVINEFGYKDIVNFFNDLGVELYVERKTNIGKLFPVTDQARTIVDMLNDEIERLGIDVILETEVIDVNKNQNFEVICKEVDKSGNYVSNIEKKFEAENLILSAGGKSYPALGSNGTGYGIAKKFGHTIIKPIPAALPIEAKSQLCHFLQGQKLEIEVTSIIEGKAVKTRTDDVMFKKYGLSGPAILNISREISVHFNREEKDNAYVRLNFFPEKNKQEVFELMKKRWEKRPDQTVEKSLYGLFPNKVARQLVIISENNPESKVSSLTDDQIENLVEVLNNYRIRVTGTRGWNEAEFTAGGIDSSEIKFKTLESKLEDKLFFCGEIIDVDGDVGGFNLSWSWASGFNVGKLIS